MSINGLEVTDVVIFPIKKRSEDSNLVAFARIVLNDQFVVSGLRIFEGKNGPFISFPKEYNKATGKGYDIVFAITTELRTYIIDQVLNQFSMLTKTGKQSGKGWELA